MRIVDSVGWIAYLTRDALAPSYRAYIHDTGSVLTPSIIVYEVYKHVLANAGKEPAKQAMASMMKTRIIPLNEGLAAWAAEVGLMHKLPMADAIIYATALSTDATLVTSDAHFEGLPQVEYIPRNPAS